MVVIECYYNMGKVGVGLVYGFVFKQGVIVGMVVYDVYNIVVVGMLDVVILWVVVQII